MTHLNIPIQFDDLLKVVDKLTEEQKQALLEHLQPTPSMAEVDLTQPRILGLHPGAMLTSADFDEPLPDEFWLSGDP